MEQEEQFSDDPEEQLRIENELLKLKLQAELGAEFSSNTDIPPDVEQEFLKQIIAFQEHQKDAPLVVLGTYIGGPVPKPAAGMTEDELEQEFAALEQRLHDKHLHLGFNADYPTAVKYEFIRLDLFPLEIMQPSEEHNWIFEYEEFHPNHAADIEQKTTVFLNDFFQNTIPEETDYLPEILITAEAKKITRSEFIRQVVAFHDLFAGISHYEFTIDRTQIDESDEPDRPSMGVAEGNVSYVIETEDHEEQTISGPFKCYFQQTGGLWNIYNIHLYGFRWDA